MATSDTVTAGTCPDCDTRPEPSGTERICPDCGLVVGADRIDHGPDWRAFDADSRAEKRRAEPGDRGRDDRGLGSVMGHYSERDSDQQRQARQHERASAETKRDRNRGYVASEVRRMSSALDLHVAGQAEHLYRRLLDADATEGRDLDTLAGVCVFLAARREQLGITADAVGAVARADAQAVLTRSVTVRGEVGIAVPPPGVTAHVRRLGAALDASPGVVSRALDAAKRLDGEAICGRDPEIVGAWLLHAAGPWTQTRVADVAGCASASIRHTRKEVGPTVDV